MTTGEMAWPQLPHATVGTPGGMTSWLAHLGQDAMRLWPSWSWEGGGCIDVDVLIDSASKSGWRIASEEGRGSVRGGERR